jgi:mannitol/fructose-specific phosphotransferase system IIA component (Ntr-type)
MTLTAAPSVLDPSLCIPDLKTRKKDGALADMLTLAHQAGAVRETALVLEILKWREKLGSTALGKGVAIPNARSIAVARPQIVIARSLKGIDWPAPDGQPVMLVLLALSPSEAGEEAHHALVARAVAASRLQRTRQKVLSATSSDAVATALREAMA